MEKERGTTGREKHFEESSFSGIIRKRMGKKRGRECRNLPN